MRYLQIEGLKVHYNRVRDKCNIGVKTASRGHKGIRLR